MRKRTKALAISREVKDAVWERDKHCCVWCGSPFAEPNAHYIARSQGGLGIEKNILTLCRECHRRYDQTAHRKIMRRFFRDYLKDKYADWDEDSLVYRRDSSICSD